MISNAHRSSPAAMEDPKLDRYRMLVAQAALFRGCPAAALDDLVRRMQLKTRTAGSVIVAQDEPGDAMFLLAQGRVKVALFGENGRELTLAVLQPGDFFGEMSMIDRGPRSASVVAMEDVVVLVLTREAFAAHLQDHPQTAVNVMTELAARLRRADETIASLALHDVEARLTKTLERLARAEGGQTEAGLVLRRRPTQQDLANMVGSCRETISRTFTSMIKRGLLETRGRALVLTPQLLERSAPTPGF
jgi:CRP-like cAMP-binding protein